MSLVKSSRGSLLLLCLLKVTPEEEDLLFEFVQSGWITVKTIEGVLA